MNHLWKRSLSLIMAIFMVLAMIPANPVHVHADTTTNTSLSISAASGESVSNGITVSWSGVTVDAEKRAFAFPADKQKGGFFTLEEGFRSLFTNGGSATVEIDYLTESGRVANFMYVGTSGTVTPSTTYQKTSEEGTITTAVYELSDAKFAGKISGNSCSFAISGNSNGATYIRAIRVTVGVDTAAPVLVQGTDYVCGNPAGIRLENRGSFEKELTVKVQITKPDGTKKIVEICNNNVIGAGKNLTVVTSSDLLKEMTAVGTYNVAVQVTWNDIHTFTQSAPYVRADHTPGEPKTENVNAPTCDKEGSHDEVTYCSVCNKEMSRKTITDAALGHDFSDENGACVRNCGATACDEGHTAGDVTVENNVAADCLNAGSYDNVTYCTVCGAETSRKTITVDALGHEFSDENGACVRNCGATACDEGHTAGDVTVENNVAADCENAGSYDNVTYCTVCGAETSRKTITVEALGHKEETVAGKDATCTATGLTEGKKCSVCNKTLNAQTVIPALGHKDGEVQIENKVAADCLNAGSYDNVTYCTVCDAETSRKTITVAALGHKEETVAGKDATCTEDGLTEGKKCTVCGETTVAQTVIKSEGHKYVSTVFAPTCVAQGYTTHVCSNCSASYTDSKVPATGEHAYENGVCSVCGDTVTSGYLLYILNGDGTVAMEINGSKSMSVFCLRTAIEDARVFANNGFLFGITGTPSIIVEMYEDSTEDKSFTIASDVTIKGNGHNIVLGDGVTLDASKATLIDVTIVEPAAKVAQVNGVGYATLADAVAAANAGDTIVIIADTADEIVNVDKNLTITGPVTRTNVTLNNVGINADGADELTVSNLSFTGNSWINSGTAEKLTVSGVTANVKPNNAGYTNSRSAFVSLGRSEQQQLALTVENCNIVSAGGSDPILGWAAITEATLTGNTFGSESAYQTNSDSVKFMAIADGATFTITGNTIYSNYNGIVFAQNTTRNNKYSVYVDGNTFKGGADHIWIEITGGDTVNATVNATSNNTVNGNAFTANDIKYHSGVIKNWSSYAGVDVVTDEEGKIIGGSFLAEAAPKEEQIAEGYVLGEDGKVVPNTPAVTYVAMIGGTGYESLAAAVAAVKEGETITILAGTIEEGTIKLPANLKNVTIKGSEGTVLKDTVISAADGNSYSYVGLTFDGLTFDNGGILLTGWRNGEETIKDLTITNCVFKNLINDTNTAPIHINKDAAEAVQNFTFTNNVIDGATGGSKSGVYAQLTGKVVFTGNVINNVSFRPYVIQLTTDDGIADEFIVTGNTFSGSAVGRAQGLGNNAAGTDSVKLVVSENIFKGITDAQQICYWNFNAETTTADLSKNYYDIDITANPSRIYFNSAAASVEDLVEKGVYPFYAELNEDGTINTASIVNAPAKKVAQIGENTYASLEEAFKAATSGCTIEILADVTIDYYWDVRDTGAKFTVPVTINGNGHTIKFTNTVYDAANYMAAFRFEADATVTDLTIDMSEAISGFAGRFRAISAKGNLTVDGCTFIGNGYENNTRAIIFGEGASAIAKVSITDSEFVGWRRAISDSESGKDVAAEIVITGNTVKNADVAVSAINSITFTGNTVEGGYVDLRSYTADNSLNVTATGNTLEANTADKENKIKAGGTINAQNEFVVPAKGDASTGYVSTTTIWGECGGNAKESFVIKIFSGETYLGSATLNNIDGILDGDVYVTWHAMLIPENETDSYWTTEWAVELTSDKAPDKIELWIDGVCVDTGAVQMNGPDGLNPVKWEELNGVKYVCTGLKGEGTAADPYLISRIEELRFFRDAVNAGNTYSGKYVKLTADIDLDDEDWTPITKFNGTFDGDNHKISNLWVTGNGNLGFFAQVADQTEHVTGTVQNVVFENVTIISNGGQAGLIADARLGARITNVKLTGDVTIQGYRGVGGIVGAGFPVITGCSVEAQGTIHATYWGVGGILGFASDYGAQVKNATVKGTGEGLVISSYLGGAGGVTGTPYGAATNGATVSNIEVSSSNNYYMAYVDAGGAVNGTISVTDVTVKVNGEEIVGNDAVAAIGTKGYFSLADAIAAANGVEVEVLRDITEELTSIKNVILTTNVAGGVTITNTATDDEWIAFENVTIGSDVTLISANVMINGAYENVIEGTLIAGLEGTTGAHFYQCNDAKTTIRNGGKVIVNGDVVLRYNDEDGAGIFIYGDNNAETVEFYTTGYIGAYSGAFYAENAVVTTGTDLRLDYHDIKNGVVKGEEADKYDPVVAEFVNSTVNVTSQLRLYKDAHLVLTNSQLTADLVQTRQLARPVVTIDSASSIRATAVEPVTGTFVDAILNADGTVSFKPMVAQLGTKTYSDLQAAIDAANAGETITLLAPIVIEAGETLTLDLAGKTITYTSNVVGEDMFTNYGKLTIDDTVGGGKIVYTNTDTTGSNVTVSTITNAPGGELTVNGGTIENASTYNNNSIYPFTIDNITNGTSGTAKTTINGGVIKSNYRSIRLFANSTSDRNTVNINGGEMIGQVWLQATSAKDHKATLFIKGGSFAPAGNDFSSVYVETQGATKPTFRVTGGYFATKIGTDNVTLAANYGIAGGTFTAEAMQNTPAGLIRSGYEFEANEDGTYGVDTIKVVSVTDAQGNVTKYATIDAAAKALTDGATITLLKDVTKGFDVDGISVTLDLNGKTISQNGPAIFVENGASLTIKDSIGGGKLVATSDAITVTNGTLVIDGGEIESTGGAVISASYATVTINDGKLTGAQNAISMIMNSAAAPNTLTINGGEIVAGDYAIATNGTYDNSTITITDGMLTGNLGGIYHSAEGTLTISGGEISGGVGLKVLAGNVTVTDGKISGTTAAMDVYYQGNSTGYGEISVAVSGGEFVGAITTSAAEGLVAKIGFITGGTFSSAVAEELCAEGYIPTKNADGTYSVKAGQFVAEVNGTKYESLADAVMAANAGETITLLADVNEAVTIAGKNLTLDLNGKKISGGDTDAISVNGGANVTIKNGTLETTGKNCGGVWVKNATALIENCTINGLSDVEPVAVYASNGATVTIKDSILTAKDNGTEDVWALVMMSADVIVENTVLNGYHSASGNGTNGYDQGTLTINGGNFNGLVYWPAKGDLIINGGEIREILMKSGAMTINGGNIGNIEITNVAEGDYDPITNVAITDGTFTGTITSNLETGFISGGTFSSAVAEELCTEGYIPVKNADGTYGVKVGQFVAEVNGTKYESLADAVKAANAGETITLLADVELDATLTINKAITINGNGNNITTSSAFVGNASNAMLDIMKDITFNNVVFDGVKNAAVMRAVSANVVMDNCVVQNCEQTVAQGLLRLACGDATITNSKFLNNSCTMVVSFGYDAANDDDVMIIDNCVFEGNTCRETAVVYFADGDYGKVTNTKFVNNTVISAGNAATLYMGWGDGFVVNGCYFDGNSVTTTHATTKRFASAIFCDGCSVTGNYFGNNTAVRNGESISTVVAVGAYYGAAEVSGNYWIDGSKPVKGDVYTVEYTRNPVALENYYTAYSVDENGNVTLKNLKKVSGGIIAYRGYVNNSADQKGLQIDLNNVVSDNSLIIKLFDANGNLLTTTSYKKGAIEADALTCNIVLWGRESSSWNTVINAEKLTVANVPAKAELWVDGELKNTFEPILGNKTDAAAYQLPAYLALDCVYKEAKIGDTYYNTLADAVEAANEGDTIILLKGVVVEAGETLTLDKDVTITYTSNVPGEDMITNRGTLNIGGNVKISYINTDTTASNVTVSTISCEPGSVLNITGGTVENKTVKADGSTIYSYAIDLLTNGNLGDVTANISGGTIYSDYMAIRQFNNGDACKNTLNITGGYIFGAKRAVQVHFDNNAAYTTISGGKIEGGYALCFLTTSENVSVTGGEFIGDVWYSGTKGFISGGTFNTVVADKYIAEDHVLVDNGNETYTVKALEESGYVAQNVQTGKYYADVFDALIAATAGQTVQLISDADAPYFIVKTGVTLDLNGYELVTEYAAAVAGANVIDSAMKGIIKTGIGSIVLTPENAMMAVYDDVNGGYIFTNFKFQIAQDKSYTGDGIKVNALFTAANDMRVIELLKNGAANNDLVLKVRLTWGSEEDTGVGSQDFTFKDATIAAVFSSNKGSWTSFGSQFYMIIKGFEGVENLNVCLMVTSRTNAVTVSPTSLNIKY